MTVRFLGCHLQLERGTHCPLGWWIAHRRAGRLVRPAPATETAEVGEQSKRDHAAWSDTGFRPIFDTSACRACGLPTEALIFGELENPLVEITPMDFSVGHPMPIEVDSGLKTALQPLLQRSSEIFRLGEEMSTKSLRVVFSPAVTRGLSAGSLELVETSRGLLPVARNASTGRFVQTGKAVAQGGVRSRTWLR